jgi:uncharacterized membrane protein
MNKSTGTLYWIRGHTRKAVVTLTTILLVAACTTLPLGTPSDALPRNTAESEIFYQAVITGSVAGGAAGALIGHQVDKDKGTWIGGAVGSVIGGLIGREVAKQQIQNLRDIQLKNDNLQAMLTSVRSYNSKAAEYNRKLEREVRQLKKSKDRSEVAYRQVQGKLRDAEVSRANIHTTIEEREKIAATLTPSQQRQLERELSKLQKEEHRIDRQISELKKLEGTFRVGMNCTPVASFDWAQAV